jgi:hypothetical protein
MRFDFLVGDASDSDGIEPDQALLLLYLDTSTNIAYSADKSPGVTPFVTSTYKLSISSHGENHRLCVPVCQCCQPEGGKQDPSPASGKE